MACKYSGVRLRSCSNTKSYTPNNRHKRNEANRDVGADPHTAIVLGSLALGNSTFDSLALAGSGAYFGPQRPAERCFEDAISVLVGAVFASCAVEPSPQPHSTRNRTSPTKESRLGFV